MSTGMNKKKTYKYGFEVGTKEFITKRTTKINFQDKRVKKNRQLYMS